MLTVCVLGMHRSGTSLLANMLAQCGVFLGPTRDIMEPSKSDNPEGYWENLHFVEINDRILKTLGGSWDEAPELSPGWSADERLKELKGEAEGIAWEYAKHPIWGWKDPRTVLTIEFWQAILPELKTIVLVRNPIEVAMSLGRRTDYSVEFDKAIELWGRYYQAMLQTVDLDKSVVIHYDSLLQYPEQELHRLAEHVGLELFPDAIKNARSVLKANLRHNIFPPQLEDKLPFDRPVQRLYALLCSHAGPYYDQIRLAGDVATAEAISMRAAEIAQVMLKGYNDVRRRAQQAVDEANGARAFAEHESSHLKKEVHQLQAAQQELQDYVRSLRAELDRHKAHIAQQNTDIKDLRRFMETKDEEIFAHQERIKELLDHIHAMEQSASWRYTRPLRSLRGG